MTSGSGPGAPQWNPPGGQPPSSPPWTPGQPPWNTPASSPNPGGGGHRVRNLLLIGAGVIAVLFVLGALGGPRPPAGAPSALPTVVARVSPTTQLATALP